MDDKPVLEKPVFLAQKRSRRLVHSQHMNITLLHNPPHPLRVFPHRPTTIMTINDEKRQGKRNLLLGKYIAYSTIQYCVSTETRYDGNISITNVSEYVILPMSGDRDDR